MRQLLYDYNLAQKYNSLTQGFVLGYNLAYLCNHHYPMVLNLNRLVTVSLREPIQVMLEPDGDGFIARSTDFSLYGFGDDRMDALQALKVEIESTYRDLLEDDDFSEEWLSIKQFLKARIIDEKC